MSIQANLAVLLAFSLAVLCRSASVQWIGNSNTSEWNSASNWYCNGARPDCTPTADDDVIIDYVPGCPNCRTSIVLASHNGSCKSLNVIGSPSVPFTLSIHSALIVGVGGVTFSDSALLVLSGELSSIGGVTVKGNMLWKSGQAVGPGAYTIQNLNVSSVTINAAVTVNGAVNVIPTNTTSPSNPISIAVQNLGVLQVHGDVLATNSLSLSGNVNIYALFFLPDPASSSVLTIEGDLIQIFQILTLAGETRVLTTFQVANLELKNNINLWLMANSQIAMTTGVGHIEVGTSIIAGIGVSSGDISISSSGQLTLSGSSIGIVNVNSGQLIAQNAGNYFPIFSLTIGGGTVSNSLLKVQNLFISASVTFVVVRLQVQGTVTLSTSSNIGISLAQSYILFTPSSVVTQKGQVTLGGDPDSSGITMNGYWYAFGSFFNPDVTLDGNGIWNISGASSTPSAFTLIHTVNLTGIMYLYRGATLTTTASDYYFNNIVSDPTSNVIANGNSVTANTIAVHQFQENLIDHLEIGNFKVDNAKVSCCSQKTFTYLNAGVFDAGIGNYKVYIQKAVIQTLISNDGVIFELQSPSKINTFQFNGGTINQTATPYNFNVTDTTYLSGNAFKYIANNTLLNTNILDCSQCFSAGCAVQEGVYHIIANTRHNCQLPKKYAGFVY